LENNIYFLFWKDNPIYPIIVSGKESALGAIGGGESLALIKSLI